MYAGRIALVATEAGVGVRMLGQAAATADDFSIDAAGRIAIGGKLSAARDLKLASTSSAIGQTSDTRPRASRRRASASAPRVISSIATMSERTTRWRRASLEVERGEGV